MEKKQPLKKKEKFVACGKKALKMRRKIVIAIFLAYLRLAARIQLFKIKPKIVALTGSQGKTSLLNAVFSVLSLISKLFAVVTESASTPDKSAKVSTTRGGPNCEEYLTSTELPPQHKNLIFVLCL